MARAGETSTATGTRFVDMELGAGADGARAMVSTPHERKLFNYPLGGLNESTQYEVWVQVITEEGESPESLHALAFTLEDVPSEPPSQVHCTMAAGAMLGVTWQPPPRYAESKMITNYRVEYRELALPDEALAQLDRSPDRPLSGANLLAEYDEQNETAALQKNESTLSTYLSELKPYTAYVIQVLSTTAFGLGARSAPLLCRTDAASALFPLRSLDSYREP